MFELDDLLRVAKRENNTRRRYLYVNPLQGKHVPVSPSLSMQLFTLLAAKVEDRYPDERLLVIGFAETATAIGASIAYRARNVTHHMSTSREEVPGAEYLYFTESHSHATEQRLAVNGLAEVIDQTDRIVFAEDEVTTGNTIEKILRILQNRFADKDLKFGIISILNSMSDERRAELEAEGIMCDYLHKIPTEYRIGELDNYVYQPLAATPSQCSNTDVNVVPIGTYCNCRLVQDVETIKRRTEYFVQSALDALRDTEKGEVLVLGTEEFMFPALLLGARIERMWPHALVRFHATTRSPIEVSLNDAYPLHSRYSLQSLYEDGRRTYVYDLDRYDAVLIVTDADPLCMAGLSSLVGALEQRGNDAITLIEWRDSVREE